MNDQPAACGAIKKYEPGSMEIKKMFTEPQYRGKGGNSNFGRAEHSATNFAPIGLEERAYRFATNIYAPLGLLAKISILQEKKCMVENGIDNSFRSEKELSQKK